MSHGVFRTNEKPYITTRGEIPPDVFRDAELFDTASQSFVADGLGFGKTESFKITIARLLEQIQNASFIPFGDVQRIPTQPHPSMCKDDDDYTSLDPLALPSFAQLTTLSPEKLINVVRLNLMELFDSCVMYHPDFHRIYSRYKKETERKNNPTIGGKDISTAQFLTYKSEAYVRAIGGISPEKINEVIRAFVQSVFETSKISCGSLHDDIEAFSQQRPKEDFEQHKLPDGAIVIPTEEVQYSTVNPNSLIRMVRENLWTYLVGIELRLDEEARKAVHARMETKKSKGQNPNVK